jgi:hypothetical protein
MLSASAPEITSQYTFAMSQSAKIIKRSFSAHNAKPKTINILHTKQYQFKPNYKRELMSGKHLLIATTSLTTLFLATMLPLSLLLDILIMRIYSKRTLMSKHLLKMSAKMSYYLMNSSLKFKK